jgi:hemerythrin-like domain-containing protein
MPKVQIALDTNEVLSSLAELQSDELETFVEKVLSLKASRKAPHLSPDETSLLQKINTGLSSQDSKRLEQLDTKLRSETLTTTEHEALMTLLEQLEQQDAERMSAVVELALLREVPLDMVMKQLGFPPDFHAATALLP